MTLRSLARLARLARVSAALLTLSVAAHLAGGGGLPAPGSAAAAGIVCAAAAHLLAGKRRSAPAYAAGLAATQVLLHLLFMATAPMSSDRLTPAMTVAHAVAVVGTACWLRHADAFAAHVLAAAARQLWAWAVPSVIPSPRHEWRAAAAVAPHCVVRRSVLREAVGRRGPPHGARPPVPSAA